MENLFKTLGKSIGKIAYHLKYKKVNTTQTKERSVNWLVVIAFMGVGFLILNHLNQHKDDHAAPISTTPTPTKTYSNNHSNASSTTANCVVCGKLCDYDEENIYTGHHVKIDGLMSSDVVCSLKCDLRLRKRNEQILNNEMGRSNGYTQAEQDQMRNPNIK